MIFGLSFIIACILTIILVIILYPIAIIFWIVGGIGKVVGIVSDWIFENTNKAIKYLWSDLTSS